MDTRAFINAHEIASLKTVIESLLTYQMVIKQSLPL